MKHFTLLKTLMLTCMLFVGMGAWAETKTLTITADEISDYPSTAAYGTYTWSVDDISGKATVYGSSTSHAALQFNSSNKVLYNTTAINGYIKKVTLTTASGTNRAFQVYGSNNTALTASNYTTSGTQIGTSTTVLQTGTDFTVENPSQKGYKYFIIRNNTSNAAYIKSVVVTYEEASTTPLKVSFNAGTNGVCLTSSITESSVGAGVILPSCTANEGYKFIGWSTDATPTSANAGEAGDKYNPAADCTLYAYYKAYHTVTITDPSNGTLTVLNEGAPVSNGDKFVAGDILNITATAAPGYKFRNIQITDNSTHTFTASNTKDWNMGEDDITIEANFDFVVTKAITWSVNGNTTTTYVEENTDIPFDAPASVPAGYVFRGWITETIDGATDVEPSFVTSAQATEDITYYAVFAVKSGDGNTASASSGLTAQTAVQYIEAGKPVTYKSSAANNYSDPIRVYKNGTFTIACATYNITKIVLKGNDDSNVVTNLTLKDGEPGSISTDEQVVTWSGSANSVTFVASIAQARISSIEVDYGTVTYSGYCTTIVIPDFVVTTADTDFYSLYLDHAVTVPSNVTAYTGSLEGNVLTLSPVEGTIPANTGVVFKTSEAGNATFVAAADVAPIANNDIQGVVADTPVASIEAGDGNVVLVLGDVDGTVCFAQPNSATLGANKAYIIAPAVSGAKGIRMIVEGETNGIANVMTDVNTNAAYNLNGQRVNANAKGIVIVNGKKVLNK